eukprot:TRINITY_DN8878_c0_g1_i6.p1 TRINITY_DN8878_c0_g1~~TRINITY_DN8878_c0_g1_i6.p1  ORF type:complete len:511 (-),score=118.31 TRINITY_DN8878_c0_g1_i6:253-1785(-)
MCIRDRCATCERFDQCKTCPENAEKKKKHQCVCKKGFLEESNYPLTCRENTDANLNCKGAPKVAKHREFVEEKLRTPETIRHWTVNNSPLKATQITQCGKVHILGGKGVFEGSTATVTKVFKPVLPHFKVLVRAKALIIDGDFHNEKTNVGTIALKIDGKEVAKFAPIKGAFAYNNECGTSKLPEALQSLIATVGHNGEELTISFEGSGFTDGAAWGLKDLHVELLPCGAGCKKCETCQKCQECNEDFLLTRDQCQCKSGFQKIEFGNRFYCDETHDCSKNKVELQEALTTSVLSSPSSIKAEQWRIGGNLSVTAEEAFTCIEGGPDEKRRGKGGKGKKGKGPVRAIGGPSVLGSKSNITKTFEGFDPHFGVRVKALVYAVAPITERGIGSVLANQIQAKIGDGTTLEFIKNEGAYGYQRFCPDLNITIQLVETYWKFVEHNETKLDLTFVNEKELPPGYGWAVRDVKVAACKCHKECASCSAARGCLSCAQEGYSVGSNGRCKRGKSKL